jgi:hypothetical protein
MNHSDIVITQITEQLDVLCSSFDTKVLAAAMMLRSAQMLRACHSAGVWKVEDVRAVVESATKNIYTPLPENRAPKVVTLDGNSTIQ